MFVMRESDHNTCFSAGAFFIGLDETLRLWMFSCLAAGQRLCFNGNTLLAFELDGPTMRTSI